MENIANDNGRSLALSPLGVDLYLPDISSMTLAFGDYVHFSLTLYMLAIGFGQLLWGSLSDRWGRRPVALWGTALFSIASLCIPLSKTFVDLCVLRCMQGLGASAASLCAATIIRDHLSGPQAIREYGILGSIRNVVPVLALLVGSGLLLFGDWTICFFFLSGSGIGLWVYLWFSMEETRNPSLKSSTIKELAPWKSIPFLGFASCCCGALSLIFSYVTLAPNALITQGGLSMQQFGLVFGVNGLCIGLSCLWFIRYVEKKGALWVIRVSLFL